MTAPAIVTYADTTVVAAAKSIDRERVKRLPVIDTLGRVIGIVTRSDLLRVHLRPDADIRSDVVDDVLRRVLGVDSSELSAAAVAFALEEPARRGADLSAVLVWTHPPGADPAGLHSAGYDYAGARAEAERMLAEQLAGVAAVYPDVRATREVIHSLDTARTLVDRSGRAQLIVVGSRRRGGVARLLLGSVSQALINRAACPVAVVRFHAHG